MSAMGLGTYKVYTDGAAIGNPGPGGYGVIVAHSRNRDEFSGGFRLTTNNRMELMGVIVGLRQVPAGSVVELYSDSKYVVNSINLGWAKAWQANNWKKADKKRAENVDLWQQVLALLAERTVSVHWVAGHAGHAENERCDRLAVAAARGRDLPVDEGYAGGAPASNQSSLFDL